MCHFVEVIFAFAKRWFVISTWYFEQTWPNAWACSPDRAFRKHNIAGRSLLYAPCPWTAKSEKTTTTTTKKFCYLLPLVLPTLQKGAFNLIFCWLLFFLSSRMVCVKKSWALFATLNFFSAQVDGTNSRPTKHQPFPKAEVASFKGT